MENYWHWLDVLVKEAAKRLLGCEIVRVIDGQVLRGRIVETEAYDQTDPASHTYTGRSIRNEAAFRSAGYAYIYHIYGLHNCLNIVTGGEIAGAAVLIRALEPLQGFEYMEERRRQTGKNLTNGPGKLCQAFSITRELNGHDLLRPPLQLLQEPALPSNEIVVTTRIGITKAADELRRFYIKANPYVSKL